MARSKKVQREMFVRTRRAWKDGSKIEIEFTSVKKDGEETTISNHQVTLWFDGEHKDSCTCQGFGRWGHCCHVKHFVIVEQLRAGMTIPAPEVVPVLKSVMIEAIVMQLNRTMGKQVVTLGVPVAPPAQLPTKPARKRKRPSALTSALDPAA